MKKNLAYLYGATFFSGLGTGMLLVLVNWIILKTYGSSTLIGGLTAASYFVCFIALPQVSLWLDKFIKRKLLGSIYVVAGLMQLLFAALLFVGVELLYVIMASTIMSVLVRMSDQMARLAIAQSIAPEGEIRQVSRHLEVVRQGITLVSGAITAWFINELSMQTMLIVDALTYFMGLLLLLQLAPTREDSPARVDAVKQSRVEAFKESVAFFSQHQYFFFLMIFSIAIYVMILAQNALHPAHVEQILQEGGETYAIIGAVFGLGALLGPAISSAFHKYAVNKEFIISFGFGIYIAANMTIVLIPHIWATYISLVLFSASHSLIRVERMAFMMEYTPKDIIGRISGSFELIGLSLVIFFTASIGFIIDTLGAQAAWFAMLLLLLVNFICLLACILKGRRHAVLKKV
ncbi:MFS transporter [Pseudoalteromonas umbrosa]|uniref:MFS transporter n=1 Tax=Pseudoalteromonas umbrosa TaxID=3048489 RepID=UPI0024C46CBC|nr:MFS transporter [Pseudoalteromonas sp. B95]MDK1290638.1 MFS transporter [Pseudoalteromonas sp. B95]